MRISDWSSDVCSSDLLGCFAGAGPDIRRRTGDNLVEIDRTRGTLGQVGRRHSLHILRAADPNRRGILPEGIAPTLDLPHKGNRFALPLGGTLSVPRHVELSGDLDRTRTQLGTTEVVG